jgi:DNA invertase Pin-like site-specific DNA recombinase
MPRPVAYLRKSRSDDPTTEVSREVQEQACRDLARRDGFDGELALLIDWDRSADESKSSRRTAYQKLLRQLEGGEISHIYAYAQDRLYRGLEGFVRLSEAARAHNVPIRTHREGLLGGDGSPHAEAFAQIGAVFANLELNTAKKRAVWAAQRDSLRKLLASRRNRRPAAADTATTPEPAAAAAAGSKRR